MLQPLKDMFWDERIWLPENLTWKDYERDESIFIPSPVDLWLVLPSTLLVCLMRLCWERYVARPLGRYCKLKEARPPKPAQNDILEKQFKKSRSLPAHQLMLELSKKLDWTPRQVERWWRRMRLSYQPSTLDKMSECSWRGIYYMTSFWCGLYIMWDKAWFWETKQAWHEYPRQHVPFELCVYYMISMGMYGCHIIYAMWDVKRKDFLVHLIHHFVAMLLLALSWSCNLVRTGALVLCVHDFADYWLKIAKMAKFLQYDKSAVILYDVFVLFWFLSRLGFFPFKILKNIMVEKEGWPVFYILYGLLILLLVLHFIWSYFILQMFVTFLVRGTKETDGRSEGEVSSTSEGENIRQLNNKVVKNGHVIPNGTIIPNGTPNGTVIANGTTKQNGAIISNSAIQSNGIRNLSQCNGTSHQNGYCVTK